MKSDNARIKELEAKIKLLEKEKEFFKLKAVAWETLVDVAEETLHISIKKKLRTQTVEKLTCRYPLLGMSLFCSLFGFSRRLGMRLSSRKKRFRLNLMLFWLKSWLFVSEYQVRYWHG